MFGKVTHDIYHNGTNAAVRQKKKRADDADVSQIGMHTAVQYDYGTKCHFGRDPGPHIGCATAYKTVTVRYSYTVIVRRIHSATVPLR